MFKLIRTLNRNHYNSLNLQFRTFLSQAYYCNEVWEHRLNSPLFQKVNTEELYLDIDQRYNKTKQISAVDVDIFANSITNDSFTDELMDIVHKLRLSADSCNALGSTTHAFIRVLLQNERVEDLLTALDDRLNYGMFLDNFTANLLLDTFWKKNDYLSGARVASQFMLQEDYESPLTNSLSLLHCYKYLIDPKEWPKVEPPPEPEEEVKIRVKYLRNPYYDDHFDLREGNQIVGKTLVGLTKNKDDALSKSFTILGWCLYGKNDKAKECIDNCVSKNITLCKEILDLIPEEHELKKDLPKSESFDVESSLKTEVEKQVNIAAEKDISNQCQLFLKWEEERTNALNEQLKRLETNKRIENINQIRQAIKEKQTKLWFFDNEETIELAIEAKKKYYPKKWFGKKKKPRTVDQGYIPPEIRSKLS